MLDIEEYVMAVNMFINRFREKVVVIGPSVMNDIMDNIKNLALDIYMPHYSIETMINKFRDDITSKYNISADVSTEMIKLYSEHIEVLDEYPYEDEDDDEELLIACNMSLSVAELNLNKLMVATEVQECAICVEDIAINTIQRVLKCNHVFHNECVDKWLENNFNCPKCRFDLRIPWCCPHCGSQEH